MENTIENKAKFFAQYWDQKVLTCKKSPSLIYRFTGSKLADQNYIILKPLSSITDEDALELHKISYPGDINHSVTGGFRILAYIDNDIRNFRDGTEIVFKLLPDLNSADYLRSKGYAISWMGLSVEQQVQYGWVQIKY